MAKKAQTEGTAALAVNEAVDQAAAEVNQEEYNFYLTEAPITEFAEYAGVGLDEAVNLRIAAARQVFDPSQIGVSVRLLGQPQGKMIGLATVNYQGFHMDQFKVFNGKDGLFLGEPTMRDGRSNNFVKTIRVSGDDLRQALNDKALEGYKLAVDKLVARADVARSTEVRPSEVKPSYREQYSRAAQQAAQHNAARPAPEQDNKAKTER